MTTEPLVGKEEFLKGFHTIASRAINTFPRMELYSTSCSLIHGLIAQYLWLTLVHPKGREKWGYIATNSRQIQQSDLLPHWCRYHKPPSASHRPRPGYFYRGILRLWIFRSHIATDQRFNLPRPLTACNRSKDDVVSNATAAVLLLRMVVVLLTSLAV